MISDIQNKFLAVPIAILLASGQMEDSNGLSLKNVLVLFGAIIFYVLLIHLIKNQHHTLDAVNSEITNKAERLKDKHKNLFIEIEHGFTALHHRYKQLSKLLNVMELSIYAALIISLSVFIYSTFC
ncbi:MAG: hypothetical protein HQL99_15275 [Magnetococcales bacterium]|nr:hypothetical protein [Magnetococcales bacterium]